MLKMSIQGLPESQLGSRGQKWEAAAMAASSTDDIPTQLAALLGYPIKRIRITDEEPPRISVIDLAAAITMKGVSQAAEQVAYLKSRLPEVTEKFGDFKFRGPGRSYGQN